MVNMRGAVENRIVLVSDELPHFPSNQCRDICSLNDLVSYHRFSKAISYRTGDQRLTGFWLDKWIGNVPLCEIFPSLSSISTQRV